MKKLFCLFLFFSACIAPLLAQDDAEGCKDPGLFTRMPGYHIYRCEDLQFDKYDFIISDGKTQSVEGHHLFIIYYVNDNVQQPSPLQIVRNYTNAVKKIGGQVLYEYEDGGMQNAIMKVVKDGKETWTYLNASGSGQYSLQIIEKEAMSQDVVADASSMAKAIRETGRVALYGIYFDTGKSELKPDSQAALDQISRLLSADTSLKLYVVGHTDNAGAYDANMKLSLDRSEAVVNALVTKYKVSALRLKACGDGPTAPVAANDTNEGKALNRRVELVKQ
jgi:OmpA-OmpF porin, OOP family